MIQEYVDRFMSSEPAIREKLAGSHPADYEAIVKLVIEAIGNLERPRLDYGDGPDPERIHQIDDGDYQGTLVFVIAERGYQPSDYWSVKIGYGSCSGCDTLQGISGYTNDPPTALQVDDYWTLALHVAQNLAALQNDEVY